MPSILLVARDLAYTGALGSLAEYLKAAEKPPATLFLEKNSLPSDTDLRRMVGSADTLVLGFSTSPQNAEMEIAAARLAIHQGKKLGFFVDTLGAEAREWFTEFRQHVSFLFVPDERTRKGIEAGGLYPNTELVVTGNPTDAKYFAPVDCTTARALVGAEPDEHLIVISGTKRFESTTFPARAVVGAAHALHLTLGWKFRVVLCVHPGDERTAESYGGHLPELRGVCVKIMKEKGLLDRLIPGANLVVNGTSGGRHANARRVPRLGYFVGGVLQADLKADRGQLVGGVYVTADSLLDIELCITQKGVLQEALISLLHQESSLRALQQEAQAREALPIKEGEAEAKMASYLLK